MLTDQHGGAQILAANGNGSEILTTGALDFLVKLHQEFDKRRLELLAARIERQRMIDDGERPDFLDETESIRRAQWTVGGPGGIPDDLQKRHVEITGPTDAKMMINALNSGADAFMADFEDANAPTWLNVTQGQANVKAAVEGTLTFDSGAPDHKRYELGEQTAILMIRPRGWHLDERNLAIDGAPISASLFDAGLFLFHNAQALVDKGSGPYMYLPKLESHLEARLWNDVLDLAEDELSLPRGTIKVTVLIETILAAFEMEEILYELRDHIVALNAGRWDYIFSVIKKFRKFPNPRDPNDETVDALLPERGQVTMTAPFMRAYTELLVQTCHKRGAHAIGGMAAFIPSRKDAAVNEAAMAKVREDKLRESGDGFDGTWVAHPDLVPLAKTVFAAALADKPHQKHRLREDVQVTAEDLLDFRIEGGRVSQGGVQANLSVALHYIESWLRGNGAVAINNLMEDTATAEICRAQLWQWIHHPRGALEGGAKITTAMCREFLAEEMEAIRELTAAAAPARGGGARRFDAAAKLLDRLINQDAFADFLTVEAAGSLEALPTLGHAAAK